MHFGLNENQVILRDSAREFFAGECPPATVRRLIETTTAHDAALWSQLAAQGYTGVNFDEAFLHRMQRSFGDFQNSLP